jgi:predicted transposase/invertase (TIGR01784 family)
MTKKPKTNSQKDKNRISHPIDKFFGRLFLDKEIVIEFLKYLVTDNFVKDLDFTTLIKGDRRGISEYDKDKTTDVLWKIKYKKQWIYIGILIEVQSSNDNTMPIRFLDYIGLYYENNYQSLEKDEKIIPIIPILLYVGSQNWNAKINFHDLVEIPNTELKKFIPDFEYIPIILNNISKEKLVEAESMLTRLLSLNKSESLDDFRELARNIFNLISSFTDRARQKKYSMHLLKYIQQVLGKKIDQEEAQKIIEDIEEGGDMFFVTLEHLFDDDKKALEKERKAKEKEIKAKEKEIIAKEKERKAKEKALKKIEKTVLRMLKKGLSIDEIADLFDLTKKEIEEIKKNYNFSLEVSDSDRNQ